MKLFDFLFLSVFFSLASAAQTNAFVYGKLSGPNDTLVGYFKLSQNLSPSTPSTGYSRMGQSIRYRSEEKGKAKTLDASKYNCFDSDSMHFETFPISTITGDVHIMLERSLNGKLQLYEYSFYGGPMGVIKTQHYYFLRGQDLNIEVNRRNFKNVMKIVLEDNSVLLQRVLNDELKFGDTKQIITLYNKG